MSINAIFISGIQTLLQDISHLQTIRRVRSERTQTINVALRLVNNRHVTFGSLGFDQRFIQNEAAHLLEPFIYGGSAPTPEALANLWVEHFSVAFQAKCALVQRVLPMMSDFVYILKSEAGDAPIPLPPIKPIIQNRPLLQV